MAAITDLWNKRREALQQAVIEAALNLFEHTGSSAFEINIPGTSPPLKIKVGEMENGNGN